MKRLFVVLLLLPSLALGAYTEFYCQNGGSNLNAGSTTNNTAAYTSTNGNWTTVGNVFTPTDGSNPSSTVSVGDFCSAYLNAATTTGFIGRVTAVQNATNGTITMNTSAAAGSPPSSGTGTVSIRCGGASKGPNGTDKSIWFNGITLSNLKNTNGDIFRLNLKNDQTYSPTVGLSCQGVTISGFSSSPADGGRATINFGTTTGNLMTGVGNEFYSDLIITSSATSGSGRGIVVGSSNATFVRVSVSGCRGSGFQCNQTGLYIECESNNNNKGNNAGDGGFSNITVNNTFIRCIASGTANGDGFITTTVATNVTFYKCIAFDGASRGFVMPSNGSGGSALLNCDAYNNASDGFLVDQSATGTQMIYMENCNAVKNTGYGVNTALTTGLLQGYMYNTHYGTGTQANGSGTSNNLGNLQELNSVNYASGVTPWVDPVTTKNFSINLPAAENTGRGFFTESQGGFSGTLGYPDVGAADHNDTCGGTGPCQTSNAVAY